MNTSPLRIGLVGYGLAGRVFHSALYETAGVTLVAVASSDAAKVHADHPGVTVHATPQALFADAAVELVVLASPSPTHAPLALEALAAGRHVLADKPFATSVAEADAVVAASEAAGLIASCYQNRRRDADFLTLGRLIADGELGEITRYESRIDRWAPAAKARWQERDAPGVGIHFDLGAHLVDQALALFGMPDWVEGDLQRLRPGSDADGRIVDTFHARLGRGRLRIELAASLYAPEHGLRFRVRGTRGGWIKDHFDPQEAQLRHQGLSTADPRYGIEPDAHLGTLTTGEPDGRTSVARTPAERGDWPSFYRDLADAIRHGTPPPVTAREARATIRVIEAIVTSSDTARRVALTDGAAT